MRKHIRVYFLLSVSACVLIFHAYFHQSDTPASQEASAVSLHLNHGICEGVHKVDLSVSSLRRGYIHPHFSSLCLGHMEFHHGLGNLLTAFLAHSIGSASKNMPVVIVGVEYGAEIRQISEMHLNVVAFEPNPQYFPALDHLHEELQSSERGGMMKLVKCGASFSNAVDVDMSYQNKPFTGCLTRVDEHVRTSVLVMQIDVQGNELDVLKGADKLIRGNNVASIVAEYQPHNCLDLMLFLTDRNYILFDFLWFGSVDGGSTTYHASTNKEVLGSIPTHELSVRASPRITHIESYCADAIAAKSSGGWLWLQNDVVAVHASFVNEALLKDFANIVRLCYITIDCSERDILRELLRAQLISGQ